MIWTPTVRIAPVAGTLAARSPDLAAIDGVGFSIAVDHRIGDAGFSQGVAGVVLDTSRCAVS